MTADRINTDKRPIAGLFLACEGISYTVGSNGCSRIEAYEEHGELGHVPWFEVYYDTSPGPVFRVNGAHVAVVRYKMEDA